MLRRKNFGIRAVHVTGSMPEVSARLMASVGCICLLAGVARGSTEVATLLPENPAFLSDFGRAVAIDGDLIAVGAPMGGVCAAPPVYVFERVGLAWRQQAEIPAAIAACDFGFSLDLDGDRLVVGGPKFDPAGGGEGEAVVYRRVGETWEVEGVLIPSIRALRDFFGQSVAISGDVIVVGAPGDSVKPGRAFIFRFNGTTWEEEAALTSADAELGDSFGESVAIDTTVVAAGARQDANAGGFDGSVTIIRHDGSSWLREDTLTRPAILGFGRSVSISADTLLVGNGGSASVFRRLDASWADEALFPILPGSFGEHTAIEGDIAVVSAATDNEASPDEPFCTSGAAYVFRRSESTWLRTEKLVVRGSRCGQFLGFDVAVSGGDAVLGTLGGAAYVFDLDRRVPTVSGWGAIVLAALFLAFGTIIVRRRACNNRLAQYTVAGLLTLSCGQIALAQTPDFSLPHVPEHLLVRFQQGATEQQRTTAHTAAGGVELRRYQYVDGLTLVQVPTGTAPAACTSYLNDINVLYAEPDYIATTTAIRIPLDTNFGDLWGMHNTGQTVNGDPGTAGI